MNKETSLSAEQVIDYLKQNPDFFSNHEDVITHLELEHKTGEGAASLMQRQVSLLRDHLTQNRERLAELARNAKHNESLLRRFQDLAVALATVEDANHAATILKRVICVDFELNLLKILAPKGIWKDLDENVIELSEDEFSDLSANTHGLSIFLGETPEKVHETVLADHKDNAQSIALISIKLGEHRGRVVIGSKDSEHFQNDMGTEFVKFLGEYVSAVLSPYFPPS